MTRTNSQRKEIMHTPSLEEVRRYWGLAVDTHRREERLAEFDRMMKDHVKSVIEESLTNNVTIKEFEDESIYVLADDVSDLLIYVIDNV